ncbi:MotB family protein [Afifella sp. IM 167]|uniref:MotB family protein n=1 Tax=Afifella sp. IM 167 TaxID=2033586 RepID=UPI001CC9AA0C|nr:MotB family protein [Afifella sp. IM 167]MBZ8131772.1 hypothetical protein [Afifella sp. IM 167]
MSDQEHQELIIIKRYEEDEHEAHSSAWKVAHADFMTAMMAFFLIMWLINVTDDEMKKSIANYFNPVKLSASVTDAKGLNDQNQVESEGPVPDGAEIPADGPQHGQHMQQEGGAENVTEKEGDAAAPNAPITGGVEGAAQRAERAAFSDPYAVLAKLAAEVSKPSDSPVPDSPVGEPGQPGVPGDEAYRDPFDPIYWQLASSDGARAENPSPLNRAQAVPQIGKLDVAARTPPLDTDQAAAGPVPPPPAASAPQAEAERRPEVSQEAIAQARQIEEQLAEKLQQSLEASDAPNVEVKATSEGILISLTDEMDYSMFEIGSAIPKPPVVVAMDKVAEVLANWPGNIIVRGYTDGRPFRSETYDNWRLSTARAHMAYYMLTRGNLPEQRIRTIEGFADRNLKNPADPLAAENRRIEILLKETEA